MAETRTGGEGEPTRLPANGPVVLVIEDEAPIRRFLRPMTWQNAPESVLPPELRDDAAVPQRVDGRLRP